MTLEGSIVFGNVQMTLLPSSRAFSISSARRRGRGSVAAIWCRSVFRIADRPGYQIIDHQTVGGFVQHLQAHQGIGGSRHVYAGRLAHRWIVTYFGELVDVGPRYWAELLQKPQDAQRERDVVNAQRLQELVPQGVVESLQIFQALHDGVRCRGVAIGAVAVQGVADPFNPVRPAARY